MATPDKSALKSGYDNTMNDMREDLTPAERAWSRTIHSPAGVAIGGLFASILLRPRSLMTGATLALVTLVGTFIVALIYRVPFNTTEPLIAFVFGWCIGLLYDLFFVISRRAAR